SMFIFSWLRDRKRVAHRANLIRPRLEILEDRAVPATFNVTTTADVVDANDGLLSLREAVQQANSTQAADTIVLPAGPCPLAVHGRDEDVAGTGDLDLTGHLTISGAGASTTVIDATGLSDRVFHVLGGNVSITGVTIRGGGDLGSPVLGGGIFNQGGTVTV